MDIETIDLKLVYKCLTKVLSRESFILTDLIKQVKSIEKEDEISKVLRTLAIDADGTLYINREFCEKYVPNEKVLTVLFLHELFHQILFDTKFLLRIKKDDEEAYLKKLASNIAMDSRINAILGHLYDDKLGAKDVFRELYEALDLETKEGLKKVDPEAIHKEEPLHWPLYYDPLNGQKIALEISKHSGSLYDQFHNEKKFNSFFDMYKEILDYLRKNKDKYDQQKITIYLLGDHSDGQDLPKDCKSIKDLSPEQIEEIRNAISEHLRNEELKAGKVRSLDKKEEEDFSKESGKNDKSVINIIETIEGQEGKKIDSQILKKVAVKSLAHNLLLASRVKVGKWVTSPIIPKIISKVDIIKLTHDIPISLWRHKKYVNRLEPKLVPIYFDVSGSMTSYIPKILDLILNIDARIEHVWCFSTYVRKHSLEQLKERKIEGDGGTRFDAVIEHTLANNFKAIMVITDGYDEVGITKEKHPDIDHITTILVPNSDTNNWFSKHYQNTHNLEEVIRD